MPTHLNPQQVEQRYVEAMGPALGRTFCRLFNECAGLHMNWNVYVALFGTNEGRVKLLNKAAPATFHRMQDALWDDTLLHICRLTDTATVGAKQTLTIRRLPQLVDEAFRPQLEQLVDTALANCKFARDWRNRHIGHRELSLALEEGAIPLAMASRQHVVDALKAIAAQALDHQARVAVEQPAEHEAGHAEGASSSPATGLGPWGRPHLRARNSVLDNVFLTAMVADPHDLKPLRGSSTSAWRLTARRRRPRWRRSRDPTGRPSRSWGTRAGKESTSS